jgi:hypothetical protein
MPSRAYAAYGHCHRRHRPDQTDQRDHPDGAGTTVTRLPPPSTHVLVCLCWSKSMSTDRTVCFSRLATSGARTGAAPADRARRTRAALDRRGGRPVVASEVFGPAFIAVSDAPLVIPPARRIRWVSFASCSRHGATTCRFCRGDCLGVEFQRRKDALEQRTGLGSHDDPRRRRIAGQADVRVRRCCA